MALPPIYQLQWQFRGDSLKILAYEFSGREPRSLKHPHEITGISPVWCDGSFSKSPFCFPVALPREPGGELAHTEEYMRMQIARAQKRIAFRQDMRGAPQLNAFMLLPNPQHFYLETECRKSPHFTSPNHKYIDPETTEEEEKIFRDYHDIFSMAVFEVEVGPAIA